MNKCSVILNALDVNTLGLRILSSKFNRQLMKYYLGKSSSPDISNLKIYLLDEVLPSYFPDFKASDLVDFLSNELNVSYLDIALRSSFTEARSMDPEFLVSTPSELKSVEKILQDLLQDAITRAEGQVKGQEQQLQEEQEKEEELNTSSEGLPTIEERQSTIWGTEFEDVDSYRAIRFGSSVVMDTLMYSTFVNDAFINNVYINNKEKKIVNQTQGSSGTSEIDTNLKNYRASLLEKLLNKIEIYKTNPDGQTERIVYSKELLNDLSSIMPELEKRVVNVKRNGTSVDILSEGTLSSLFDEFSKSRDPELENIINNYLNFLIFADFDTLLKFYIPDTLFVDLNNGDFDQSTRKYSTRPVYSSDSYNSSWEDKVQNGVELTSDIYKMVINSTRVISYVTGETTNEFLYPSAISHAFAPLFNALDRENPIASIRSLLIQSINDKNNSISNKEILYTIYKKFFELEGDNIVLPAVNKNTTVESYLSTLRYSGEQDMHPLMLLIIKPLQEIAKVVYGEAIAIGRKTRLNLSSAKVGKHSAENLITKSINKSEVQVTDLFDRYQIEWDGNSYRLKGLDSDTEYVFSGRASDSVYDLGIVTSLSKDLVGLDFEDNKAHQEFFKTLQATSKKVNDIDPVYIRFLHDALRYVHAKKLLYDPDVISEINQKGVAAAIEGGGLLNDLIASGIFGTSRNPANVNIKINTQSANEVYNLLQETQQRYTGNRLKSTVYTVEGTTVAAFSVYNYFLGFNHNLNRNISILGSIASKGKSVLDDNIIYTDNNLMSGFLVRGAAKVGNTVKPNSKQLTLETTSFNINVAYFGEIAKALETNSDPKLAFDITVYSDKTTNFLPLINNQFLDKDRRNVQLFLTREDNRFTAVNPNVTRDLLYQNNKTFFTTYGDNLASDWMKIYEESGNSVTTALADMSTSERLQWLNDNNDNFWKNTVFENGLKGLDAVRFYANRAGVEIVNWVHFQNKDKELRGTEVLKVKDDLIREIEMYEGDRSKFEQSYDEHLIDFANNLLDIGFKFDSSLNNLLTNLYPSSNYFTTSKGDHKVTILNSAKSVSDIHPAIVKYFYDYNLVSSNIMQATLGPVYAHKGDNPAQMLITQLKRNVAAPASIRLYSLGLLDGVDDESNVAFVDDFVTNLKTVLSPSEKVVSFDGSSFTTYTARVKTWNSLNQKYGNDGGLDHKSFISDYDPVKGIFKETKHAEFTLTNDLIKKSLGSEFDLYEFHKQLYRGDVSKVDITESFGEVSLSNFSDVYYMDDNLDVANQRFGTIYKLESIEYNGLVDGVGNYTVTKTNLNTGDKEIEVKAIATFFDIWEVLGSYKSVSPTDNKSSLSVMTGRGLKYFVDSHKASEKLLDYEAYIGNEVEYYIKENQIPVKNKSDRDLYSVYKSLFNTKGIVNSHLGLIEGILNGESISQEELYRYDVNPEVAEASAFIKRVTDNTSKLKKLFNLVLNNKGEFKYPAKKYQRFKGINIDRISTAGAQKVGQYFLNSNTTYLKSKREAKYKQMNVNTLQERTAESARRLISTVDDNYEGLLDLLEQQGIISKTC